MKNIKKLVGIMLALVMVLAMAVPAFAATETGSITITSPVADQTYNIYKMFNLVSHDATSGAYSYTVEPAWESFITTGEGKNYFKVEDGLVKIQDGKTILDNSTEAAELAKAALAYVNTVNSDADTTNNIDAVATLPNADSYTATGLSLGYYLVDSSLGALCGLTTTDLEATVNEKNTPPSIDKKIVLGPDNYVTSNTVYGGDTVEYRTTIRVEAGAENYVLHDKMDSNLALQSSTISVKIGNADVAPANYTLYVAGAAVNPTTDSHTFDIEFKNEYIKTLAAGTEIIVSYKAILSTEAEPGVANKNDTYLNYGDSNETTHKTTETYTYSFDLVKTKKDHTVLNGAKFELYDASENGNKIPLVKVEGKEGVYRYATATESGATGFTSAVIDAGKATITGLKSGTYWLQETQHPAGYNPLAGRVEVTITDSNLVATYKDDAKTQYDKGGIEVINYTGSELPSTGGTGTVIFYIVGGVLLVGAGVILVVRKRMSAEKKSK